MSVRSALGRPKTVKVTVRFLDRVIHCREHVMTLRVQLLGLRLQRGHRGWCQIAAKISDLVGQLLLEWLQGLPSVAQRLHYVAELFLTCSETVLCLLLHTSVLNVANGSGPSAEVRVSGLLHCV